MSIAKTLDKVMDAAVAAISNPEDPNKKLARRFKLALTEGEKSKFGEIGKLLDHIDAYHLTLGAAAHNYPNSKRRLDARENHLQALLRGETPDLIPGDMALGEACQTTNENTSRARQMVWERMTAFAKPIAEQFCAIVEGEIQKLEMEEKAQHEDYEVSHQRSAVVQRLVDFQKYIRLCATAHRPDGLFPYLES